jgi:hypothetical protein
MGNRVVITFDKKPTRQSLGIYLRWNGGPESVLAFLEAANEFRVRRGMTLISLLASFRSLEIILEAQPSIGVDKLSKLDCDNGHNGVLRVSRAGAEGAVEIHQSKRGKLGTDNWAVLDLAKLKEHHYWTGPTPILGEVVKANALHFPKET